LTTDAWLGIETTARGGGVAVVSGEKLLAEFFHKVDAVHSEELIPAVSQALEAAELDPYSLAGIGVSLGPGSYTGLRIGVSSATGLSAGWSVPLKGVGTLRVLAAAALSDEPLLVCIKARKEEVFAAIFRSSNVHSEEIIPPGVYRVSSLEERLASGLEGIAALGNGRSELKCASVRWLPQTLDSPRAFYVALLAAELARSEGYDSELEPLYMREFNQKAEDVVP
jgi:tRNA threonylcarbamoyladenosine biosynthesis protein TsaB